MATNLKEIEYGIESNDITEEIIEGVRRLLDYKLPSLKFNNYFEYNGNTYTVSVLKVFSDVRVRVEYKKHWFDCEIYVEDWAEEVEIGYKSFDNSPVEDIGLQNVMLEYIKTCMEENIREYCALPFIEYFADTDSYINTEFLYNCPHYKFYKYVYFLNGENNRVG